MADLYTHILTGFILAVVISWKLEWITRPYVGAAVVGAMIPDLSRLELVFPAASIESMTGLTWSWSVLHRAGGVLLIILLITTLVPRRHMKAVFVMVLLGVASHFTLDYMLWQPSGGTNLMLWPFADIHLDFQGFYRSYHRWPAVLATITAVAVIAIDRRFFGDQGILSPETD